MENAYFGKEFIAGNVGGIIGITAVYPLDTLKVRLQVMPQAGNSLTIIRTMIVANGIGSMYRGLASPAFGFGINSAIAFR